MLVVCAAFHVYYAAAVAAAPLLAGVYPVNELKWAEYAVSATLGTLAASGPPDDAVLWLLVAASVVQMAVGYWLDTGAHWPRSLVAAGFLLQVPLSWVVIATAPLAVYPYVYTAGYGAFGVLCWATLGTARRDGLEAAYTALSWTTKCAVAWSLSAPLAWGPPLLVLSGWLVALYVARRAPGP